MSAFPFVYAIVINNSNDWYQSKFFVESIAVYKYTNLRNRTTSSNSDTDDYIVHMLIIEASGNNVNHNIYLASCDEIRLRLLERGLDLLELARSFESKSALRSI